MIDGMDDLTWYRRQAFVDGAKFVFPAIEFGAGHVVFSDYNLSDDTIWWCIENFEEMKTGRINEDVITDQLLHRLLTIQPIPERGPIFPCSFPDVTITCASSTEDADAAQLESKDQP